MLSVNRLYVSYGRSRVITDVSFIIGNGERLAVLGRNGVGKTTLLKSIIGLLPPAGGNIIWNGTDISRLPAHRRSRLDIAYVPQGREILPELTVMENLQLGCLERGNMQYAQRRAERMLEYFPELKKHLSRPGGSFPAASSSSSPWRGHLPLHRNFCCLMSRRRGYNPMLWKTLNGF